MWRKWLSAHGSPPGLVARRALPPGTAARALPQDIHHYSFDRAAATYREDTVYLPLANNFHFENNCAILAVGGYPAGAFETVRAMLRESKLIVYVLHDASVVGCQLAQRVRNEGWFSAQRAHHRRRPLAVHAGAQGLLEAEHVLCVNGACAWPARGRCRVADPLLGRAKAIRPEQIIKRRISRDHGGRRPSRRRVTGCSSTLSRSAPTRTPATAAATASDDRLARVRPTPGPSFAGHPASRRARDGGAYGPQAAAYLAALGRALGPRAQLLQEHMLVADADACSLDGRRSSTPKPGGRWCARSR